MKVVKRINYFDILKAVSIIFVIYLHYPWTSASWGTNITMMICYIAVPLFLMINGALILNKKINIKKHYKKTVKYLITLIVWKTLTIIVFILLKQINLSDYNWFQIVLSIVGDYNLPGLPTKHLWYLYALIKIYMIIPFIQLFIEKYKNSEKYIIIFLIIVIFVFELLQLMAIGANKFLSLPYYDLNSLIETYKPITAARSLIYFLLGYYLHNKFYNKKISKKAKIGLITMFVIGLVFLCLARYIQVEHFVIGDYVGIRNEYHKFGTLIMAISVFILAAGIDFKENRIISYVSKNTLNIYLIHMMLCKWITIYLAPIIGIYGAKGNIIKTIIVFFTSFILSEILKRIKPVKKILNLS